MMKKNSEALSDRSVKRHQEYTWRRKYFLQISVLDGYIAWMNING